MSRLKGRFEARPQLHEGVDWEDVEKSLKADPEAMQKLHALDVKGHNMNVFGEENGEFIFVSGWDNWENVSEDHRNIVFDKKAQEYFARNYPNEPCNGNAVDIATAFGVDLADKEFHEQLRNATNVSGWAWLKIGFATRKRRNASFAGYNLGIGENSALAHAGNGSFRAALRVKKA